MLYCGLDYSMSGPALTICKDQFDIKNCKIYFLTDVKKYQNTYCNGLIIGNPLPKFDSQIERYENIADHFINLLEQFDSKDIKFAIEGYAMGAKGLIFNIAEHTAIMKYKLYKHNIPFNIIAPSESKKRATGKGNAKKNDMYESFKAETLLDLCTEMEYNKVEIASPISDIVDSYFIAKCISV